MKKPLPETLEQAWQDFAGAAFPPGCEEQYNAMEVSFYLGAGAFYRLAQESRRAPTMEEAMKRMENLYDELDFFLQSLKHRDMHIVGDRGTLGNA